MHEVCIVDEFDARCPQNFIIMMTYAMYGRMDFGKCISSGTGNIGCKTDVLAAMDTFCSGKEECVLDKPVNELIEHSPCQVGSTPYLKTSFNCLEGIFGKKCQI